MKFCRGIFNGVNGRREKKLLRYANCQLAAISINFFGLGAGIKWQTLH